MSKYSLYGGEFICHRCKLLSNQARLWKDTYDLTWICPSNHLSKVKLDIKGY